jgi:predicted porin
MKKSLLALAALSAFASAAQAQPSVTISGNLEMSYQSVEVNNTVTNAGSNNSIVGTPFIQFAGREDLGGGAYAGFGLVMDVETRNGNTDAGGTTTTFAQSFVTLGSKTLGEVKAGRFDAVGRDAAGVYRFMGDIGRIEASGNPGNYASNNVGYTSPAFGGVTVAVSASDGGQTASGTEERINSAIVRGSFGKLNAAYSTTNVKAAYTAATATAGNNTTDMFAAGYDFGIAKVGAFYMTYKDNSSAANTTANSVNGMGVNVAFNLAKNLDAQIGIQEYEEDATSSDKTDMMSVGVKYTLSKRTALYATYQEAKGGTGVANGFDTTRGLDVVAGVNKKNSGYGVSLVHTF